VADRILDALGGVAPTGPKQDVPPYATPVFVPAHPRYPGGGRPAVIALELLALNGTTPVPVAFTTLERLVAALGPAQPWIAVSLGPFAEGMAASGLPAVRLDPKTAEGAASWRAEDLEDYARKVACE
jgi:hypothetical protein